MRVVQKLGALMACDVESPFTKMTRLPGEGQRSQSEAQLRQRDTLNNVNTSSTTSDSGLLSQNKERRRRIMKSQSFLDALTAL